LHGRTEGLLILLPLLLLLELNLAGLYALLESLHPQRSLLLCHLLLLLQPTQLLKLAILFE